MLFLGSGVGERCTHLHVMMCPSHHLIGPCLDHSLPGSFYWQGPKKPN